MFYGERFLNINRLSLDNLSLQSPDILTEAENYITEFSGDQKKVERFSSNLKEMGELINLYIDRIEIAQKVFDKQVSLFMSITQSNILTVNKQITDTGKKGNDELLFDLETKRKESMRIWGEFKKLNNFSITVKYSEDTMKEKEKFIKKFKPYTDRLDKIYNKYDNDAYWEKLSKKKEQVLAYATKIGKNNKFVEDMVNVINSWYMFMVNEINYTKANLLYIYKKFGSTDNPIFKVLNKDYKSDMKKNFNLDKIDTNRKI